MAKTTLCLVGRLWCYVDLIVAGTLGETMDAFEKQICEAGDEVRWEPLSENTLGRKIRAWMRFGHTGEAGRPSRLKHRQRGLSWRSFSRLHRYLACYSAISGLLMQEHALAQSDSTEQLSAPSRQELLPRHAARWSSRRELKRCRDDRRKGRSRAGSAPAAAAVQARPEIAAAAHAEFDSSSGSATNGPPGQTSSSSAR